MTLAELRARMDANLASWDTALATFEAIALDAEDYTAREADVTAAHTAYDRSKAAYGDREAIDQARAALPVVPFEDTDADTIPGSVTITKEPLTYEREAPTSMLRDLFLATRPGEVADSRAVARLERHRTEMETEKRAISSTDGSGGEFVPPLWLQDEFIALVKAGRPFADAVRSMPLPKGTDSISFPSVVTGATTATQADAGAVSDTNITTGSYNVGVKTVAGQQDMSMQLMDRSMPGMDVIVFEELAGRYAINLDAQCLAGSGAGANAQGIQTLAATNSITYTDATPTVQELYPKVADAIQQIHTGRFLPPSAIFMHPRRWAWFLASLDSSGRPLVTPYAPQNSVGILSSVAPENIVGSLQGLPVIVDSSIATNLGVGVNEDIVYVVRLNDLWLMEDAPIKTRLLYEVLSGTLQVRAQLYNYFAFAAGRYPKSISKITGTGLIAPTF